MALRKIKFRGQRCDNGEWLYGNLIVRKNGYVEIFDDRIEDYRTMRVYPYTVGQYTGLKDNNGKEIYEGDIVRWQLPFRDSYTGNNGWSKSMLCEVKFEYGAFYINEYPYVLGKTLDFDDGKDWRLEVVGNIHEKKQENE